MARIFKQKGKNKESWILDYTDATGRHRPVIGHTDTMTKKQAERIRVERELEIYYQKSGVPILKKISTKEFFERFKLNKKRVVSERTFRNYISKIRFWEDIHLKQSKIFIPLNRLEIDKAIDNLSFRPRTINHYIMTIKEIYNYAEELKLIRENPAKGIKNIHKKSLKAPRFYSMEEIRLIFENCSDFYKDLFQFMLYTGLRKDEVKFLEWNDIDFKKKEIMIRFKRGFSPKSREERKIIMHPIVEEILNKLSKESNYVFPSPRGGMFSDNTWYYYLKRKLKKLNIENANLHTFRHTFASWLTMEGITMRKLQNLLGHKSINTIMIYSHLSPHYRETDVYKMPDWRIDKNGE